MTDTRQYNVDEGRECRYYLECGINQISSETYHRKGPLSKSLRMMIDKDTCMIWCQALKKRVDMIFPKT